MKTSDLLNLFLNISEKRMKKALSQTPSTDMEKVNKILLLLACPKSPLFWHMKFHMPWDVK
jgi:hypothetical protein